ncbi:unnamed protein product [Polarella glacialis]|uniref:EamA domain-containing protein n=1 Tax=Polarella glacialis TaxID=89957 RepID=A0A813ECJ1_POLGL|nr:unnamed protein product [Polarella glacialis]
MGGLASIILGLLLAVLLARGTYPLDLSLVPWAFILATALSSALFNFLIKVGLSRETPVTMSMGTQLGIPLNLVLDVLVVRSGIDLVQAVGCLTMLASFTLWHMRAAHSDGREQGPKARLLGSESWGLALEPDLREVGPSE